MKKVKRMKILDFDIEARPLSWYGGDFVSKEVTAIAARWVGDLPSQTMVWTIADSTVVAMLEEFRAQYDSADIVTGHYIRGFDLPLLNAAMIENGLPPLGDKLTQDTKLDLVRRHGMSNSLENLGSDFGLREKVNMTQADWREANRLTPTGVARMKERVVSDVSLHIKLRDILLEKRLLRPVVPWSSVSSGATRSYHA